MKKRLGSILLTICLLAGLLPWMAPIGRADSKILESIEVTYLPKTEYLRGESFDPGGMIVAVTYSDGSSEFKWSGEGCTITPMDDLQPSDTFVTVSYTENGVTKTTTQAITVLSEALTLTGIEVTTTPAATGYTAGASFDPAGMVVTATYSNGSTREVTDYTYEPSGPLQETDEFVMISYTEGGVTTTTTQPITVNAAFVPEVYGVASLGRITLGWTVETSMTKSELQRRVWENGAWGEWTTLSGELTQPEYEDLALRDGATYQYRARGYYGEESRWSGWGASPEFLFVAVQSVTLDRTALPLFIGQRVALTATVLPENASEKRVAWRSDSILVAEVDADGVVTAHRAGTAHVTVTSQEEGSEKSATCTVTVTEANAAISGSVHDTTLTYSVTGAPANAVLIAARYDGNGRLLGATRKNVGEGSTENATMTVASGAAAYKLLLVDRMTWIPLCAAAPASVE